MNLQKKISVAVLSAASILSLSSMWAAKEPKADIPTSPSVSTVQQTAPINQTLIAGEAPVSFINAIGRNRFVLSNFNRIVGEAQILLLSSSLLTPIVSEEFYMLFSAKKRAERIYIPERPLGKVLKKIMDPHDTYRYKGSPIIDEINKGYSFRLSLSSDMQAHEFVTLLRNNQNLLTPKTVKPLLYIQSHPTSTLSDDERTFLSTYFTISDSQETRAFFVESQKQLDDIDASGLGEEYKTSWEAIYNRGLIDCKKFKTEKIVPAFMKDVIPGVAKSVVKAIVIGYMGRALYNMTAPEGRQLPELRKEDGSWLHHLIKLGYNYTDVRIK